MRWLLHGNLTPAVGDALVRHGHSANRAVDLGIDAADGIEMLNLANRKQVDIVTDDAALVNAPFEQDVRFDRCIVFLQLPGGDVEQDDAIDRLFHRYKRLAPGRVYTVTGMRVKVRQLPAK